MKKSKFSKDDLYKNLDITNSWINNCDTKASIMIAFLGFTLFELIKNTSYIDSISKIFNNSIKNFNFSDCLYLLFLVSSFILILIGLYKLIKVLIPSLENNKKISVQPSFLYYGYISSIERLEYNELIKNATEEEIIDDLINQNYINSKICYKKFNNFKYGTFLLFIGLILNLILVWLGSFIYK